jgi:hypothetical protein
MMSCRRARARRRRGVWFAARGRIHAELAACREVERARVRRVGSSGIAGPDLTNLAAKVAAAAGAQVELASMRELAVVSGVVSVIPNPRRKS